MGRVRDGKRGRVDDGTPTNVIQEFDAAPWGSALLQGLNHPRSPTDETWLQQVFDRAAGLPSDVQLALDQLRAGVGPVALHVRGLARPESMPPTPSSCTAPPARGEAVGEFWLALFASKLGWLFAHREICNGDLFHHVAPVTKHAYAPTGESSLAPLRVHTDGASHPMPPDHVLLWCHRGDPRAGTCVADASDLLRHVGADVECLLREPQFRHVLDFEFGMAGQTADRPIVFGDAGRPRIALDADFVRANTPRHEEAVQRLEDAFHAIAERTVLEPGGLLIIDNRRSLHGREAFQPRFDGSDRWLQAAYTRYASRPQPTGVVTDGRITSLEPS